jgi:anti-anti-sigma regulatory factor
MAREHGLAGLCAYDATVVEPFPGAIAAVHPLRNAVAGPFGVFVDADGCCVLEGEVDFFETPHLEEVLAALELPFDLDMGGLRFADASALTMLASAIERRGGDIRVRRASPYLRRIWHILGLDPGVFEARVP